MKRIYSAALLALLVAGCKKKEATQPDLPPVNLETMTVTSTATSANLTVPAHVEADPTHLVHVFAPISGQLLSLNVIAGQEVRKGQTIAILRSGDVANARATFETAKIEADRTLRARDRAKLLLDHEVLSLASYEDLKAAADGAAAQLFLARQRLHELGFSEKSTSDEAPIVAPIAGTVLEVGTSAGEMQRSLETANGIVTIANLNTVWVEGEVFERDLALLKRAQQVTVTVPAYPGEVFRGTLANVGDVFDPSTHTLRARVVLANPGHRLKPAMFASLVIARPAAHTISVPQTAVVHDGESTGVYVQGADNKFTLRAVGTGASHDGLVEITGGLHDGERILKSGAAFMRPAVGD